MRALLASVLVAACDADLYTERGQVRLTSEDLSGFFLSGRGIAEQSIVCLDRRLEPGDLLDDFDGEPDADLDACYDERLVGPTSVDEDGCLVFDTPGTVDLELERRPCAIDGDFGDDRLRFEVLAPGDLRGAFEYAVPIDAAALERWDAVVEDPSSMPGWLAEVGEPVFVIEDLFEGVSTTAIRSDRPEEVAVTLPHAEGTAVAGSPALDLDGGRHLGVDANAGDVFHVTLSLPAGTLDVGDVHVVARSEAVELVLAPSILRSAGDDEFLALGAQAVARDRDGTVLREPPVWWSVVEGDVELDPWDHDDDGRGDPSWWTNVADDGCDRVAAGTWRSAILAGEMDEMRETVELRWQCIEGGDDGCACSLDDRRGAPGGALLVLLFVFRRVSRPPARRGRSTPDDFSRGLGHGHGHGVATPTAARRRRCTGIEPPMGLRDNTSDRGCLAHNVAGSLGGSRPVRAAGFRAVPWRRGARV